MNYPANAGQFHVLTSGHASRSRVSCMSNGKAAQLDNEIPILNFIVKPMLLRADVC